MSQDRRFARIPIETLGAASIAAFLIGCIASDSDAPPSQHYAPLNLQQCTDQYSGIVQVACLASSGDGSLGDPWDGWAASFNALTAFTAHAHFAPGYYKTSIELQCQVGMKITGGGDQQSIILLESSALSGLVCESDLNASAPIALSISDIGFRNTATSALPRTACLRIRGGSFYDIERVQCDGFGHSIILDQAEDVRIRQSWLRNSSYASIWGVNGPDLSGCNLTAISRSNGQITGTCLSGPDFSLGNGNDVYIYITGVENGACTSSINNIGVGTASARLLSVDPIAHTFTAEQAGDNCVASVGSSSRAGIGAPLYTNAVTIQDTLISAREGSYALASILIDGGGQWRVENNDIGAYSQFGVCAAGVYDLSIEKNSCESVTQACISLHQLKGSDSTTFVGQVQGFEISNNNMSHPTNRAIDLHHGTAGQIYGNFFNRIQGSSAAAIVLWEGGANDVTNTRVWGNSKMLAGATKVAPPFLGGFTVAWQRNEVQQRNQTYITSGPISAGVRTVTPATMGYIGTEIIAVGSSLYCANPDGSNGETVTVTAVQGGSSLTAEFTTSKVAEFTCIGI